MNSARSDANPLGFFEFGAELPVNRKHAAHLISRVDLARAGGKQARSERRRHKGNSVGGKLMLHFKSPVVVRTSTVAGRREVASLSPEGRDK